MAEVVTPGQSAKHDAMSSGGSHLPSPHMGKGDGDGKGGGGSDVEWLRATMLTGLAVCTPIAAAMGPPVNATTVMQAIAKKRHRGRLIRASCVSAPSSMFSRAVAIVVPPDDILLRVSSEAAPRRPVANIV